MTEQDQTDLILIVGMLRGMLFRFEEKLDPLQVEKLQNIDKRIEKMFYSKQGNINDAKPL